MSHFVVGAAKSVPPAAATVVGGEGSDTLTSGEADFWFLGVVSSSLMFAALDFWTLDRRAAIVEAAGGHAGLDPGFDPLN